MAKNKPAEISVLHPKHIRAGKGSDNKSGRNGDTNKVWLKSRHRVRRKVLGRR